MGSHSAAIFADDTAMDVRDSYRDLISGGKSHTQSVKEVFREYGGEDDESLVCLALAATAWRMGRLDLQLRRKAIAIIDNETELKRWKEMGATPATLRHRQNVLTELRQKLLSDQPKPTAIKKRILLTAEWRPGEIIRYTLLSGKFIYLRVVGIFKDAGGEASMLEILELRAPYLPPSATLKNIPARKSKDFFGATRCVIYRKNKKDFPVDRLLVVGRDPSISLKTRNCPDIAGVSITLWCKFDKVLRDSYKLA